MRMLKEINREKVNFYAACLLVFSLPFYRWISTYFIAIWIITWLIEGNFRKKFNENKNNYLLFIPIAFYIIYCISVLYSENKPEAYFDLEVKLSFFLFPLILLTSNKLYKEKFIVLLKVFVIANLVAAIACLINAFIQSASYKNGVFIFHHDLINAGYSNFKLFMIAGTRFMYTSLSMFMHPGYFSLYINFSISIILFLILKNQKGKILWGSILVFFSFFNYLLFSRAGIISFLVITVVYFIYSIINSSSKFSRIIKTSVFIVIISVGVSYILRNERMQIAFKELEKFKLDKSFIKGNNDDRIPVWYVTSIIIKENPIIGVGTGDVKDELKVKYLEYDLTEAYTQDLNVHNQLLETFLGTGITGFILILLMLFYPIVLGIKQRNLLQIVFFCIIFLLMMVESVFNGQAGVVFFVLFYCLFAVNSRKLLTK